MGPSQVEGASKGHPLNGVPSGRGSSATEALTMRKPGLPIAAVLLPRMPAGLMYVASPRSYDALAVVVRSLGRMAASADAATSGTCNSRL